MFDALLQWGDAYRTYAANYPIAKWRIDKERRSNPAFQAFFDVRPDPPPHPALARRPLGR